MRFLGNKTRMLENIKFVMDDNKINGEIFCDLFAGSGSVGDYLKHKFKIISNDYLYSLSIINKAKLTNETAPSFTVFMEKFGQNPFDYFNSKNYVADSQYFITNNYSPNGGRQYFSVENAVKIDGIRIEIETLYKDFVLSSKEREFLLASLIESAMGVSNTTGTYEAFLKTWDKRALKQFVLTPIELNNVKPFANNTVYNKDSNELIRTINGDILYIDPPYTVTDYNAAYNIDGILNKLEKIDNQFSNLKKFVCYANTNILKSIGIITPNDDDIIESDDDVKDIDDIHRMPDRGIDSSGRKRFKTQRKIRDSVLEKAHYLCDCDDIRHFYFEAVDLHNYVEGHHVVPMNRQEEYYFDSSINLDVPNNIVALCPNCHCQIHLGSRQARLKILSELYVRNKAKLLTLNSNLTLSILASYYNIGLEDEEERDWIKRAEKIVTDKKNFHS